MTFDSDFFPASSSFQLPLSSTHFSRKLLQAAGLSLSDFHLVSQYVGFLLNVIFRWLLNMKSLPEPLAKSASQVPTAGSSAAKTLNLKTGRVLVGLGTAEDGIDAQGIPPLLEGSAPVPRLGVSLARGGTADQPPAPSARRALVLRPPAGVRRDSCRPFLKTALASRNAGVGKRGRGLPGRFLGKRSGCYGSLESFGWWRGGLLRKGDCLPLILNYEDFEIVLEEQSVLQLLGRNNCWFR